MNPSKNWKSKNKQAKSLFRAQLKSKLSVSLSVKKYLSTVYHDVKPEQHRWIVNQVDLTWSFLLWLTQQTSTQVCAMLENWLLWILPALKNLLKLASTNRARKKQTQSTWVWQPWAMSSRHYQKELNSFPTVIMCLPSWWKILLAALQRLSCSSIAHPQFTTKPRWKIHLTTLPV